MVIDDLKAKTNRVNKQRPETKEMWMVNDDLKTKTKEISMINYGLKDKKSYENS